MLSERVVRFQFCSSCSEDQNLVSCLFFFFLLFFVVFYFYMKIENMNYSLFILSDTLKTALDSWYMDQLTNKINFHC